MSLEREAVVECPVAAEETLVDSPRRDPKPVGPVAIDSELHHREQTHLDGWAERPPSVKTDEERFPILEIGCRHVEPEVLGGREGGRTT